jgi:serine-type D-Ala-D-Ala carboxypeptidase
VERSDPLTSLLQEGVANRVFPGAVLYVRQRNRLRYHEAVGALSSGSNPPPVHLETIYDLASLTKPLATVSAILLLIQSGQLGVNQPLAMLLPETKTFKVGCKTVRDLLCHQGGLPAWRPYYRDFSPEFPWDEWWYHQRVTAVCERICEEPLTDHIGGHGVYSDLGYMMLGFVVERLTGRSLAHFCQEEVFGPLMAGALGFRPCGELGKENSAQNIAPTEWDPWRGRLLLGEVHDGNAYALGGVAGHAGLFGTAEAVSQVTRAWLNGYLGRTSCFSSELVRQFVKPQPGTSWGLGWDTPTPPSSSGQWFFPESFGHLGFTGTSIWIDPIRELEVIFLSNRVHPTRDNQAIKTFRPLLHDRVIDTL